MSALVYNPITRFAVRGLVTYAYVHLALDIVQGTVWIARKMKNHFAR